MESVLPPLPTPDQTTPHKVSFETPQNWGTPSSETAPPTSQPNITNPINTPIIPVQAGIHPNSSTKESSPSFFKIFLISICLILLGVLLGVLAAKFFQPAQTSDTPLAPVVVSPEASPGTIVLTPIIIPTPTATSEALLKLNWKNFTNSTYKLFYPSTWTRKSVSGGITLTKGTVTISLLASNSSYVCDKQSIQSFVKDNYLWNLQESSISSQYYLCETTEKGQSPNTSIGSVNLMGPKVDTATLDEFKYILEKIEILDKSTQNKMSYECPANGWVSCMPILSEEGKKACTEEAKIWYTNNCPNFQGIAM